MEILFNELNNGIEGLWTSMTQILLDTERSTKQFVIKLIVQEVRIFVLLERVILWIFFFIEVLYFWNYKIIYIYLIF